MLRIHIQLQTDKKHFNIELADKLHCYSRGFCLQFDVKANEWRKIRNTCTVSYATQERKREREREKARRNRNEKQVK